VPACFFPDIMDSMNDIRKQDIPTIQYL